MNEFLEQFVIEGRELVEQGIADLLALEQRPKDEERLDSVFRAVHTLKGSAGIIEFPAMARALHGAEDVLAAVRAGQRAMVPDLVSDCLACLDQVLRWIEAIEATGALPAAPDQAADALAARFATPQAALPPDVVALLDEQALMVADAAGDGLAGRLAAAAGLAAQVLSTAGWFEAAQTVRAAGDAAIAAGAADGFVAALRAILAPLQTVREDGPAAAPGMAARALRVEVERIDALVRLTAELTTAKNALGHAAGLAAAGHDPAALAALLREQHTLLDRLVAALQRSVLGIRVLPLRTVFQRFPRLVRELAASLGKPVRLVTEGDDTEADKAVVEALFEPLLHLVRNAIDHGIESPERRRSAGKPATGTIRLRAARAGESVLVEVSDDGGGIDAGKVRATALARGIAGAEALAGMREHDLVQLIFAPGFSTATVVTGTSGRGVGMDAVQAAVGRMGGRIAVASRPGEGTVVGLTLAFSALMLGVMTVEAGGQSFGIPLEAVVETVRVPRAAITRIGAAEAVVLRHRTVPLVNLAALLGLGTPANGATATTLAPEATIVVTGVGGQAGAIEVDRVGARQDVMLKPLDGLLAGMHAVVGATLLGDGRVLIVLDVQELLA